MYKLPHIGIHRRTEGKSLQKMSCAARVVQNDEFAYLHENKNGGTLVYMWNGRTLVFV